MERKNITVGVPNEKHCHIRVAGALLALQADTRFIVHFDFTSAVPVDNCRNQIVKTFLKTDHEYLFFMDSDNPPHEKCKPFDLVSLDKDIIILPTPMWKGSPDKLSLGLRPIQWNAFIDYMDIWLEYPVKEGLKQVEAGGTGCILIHRRVLEKVKPAFRREWDEDGCVYRGSDLLFCRRAIEEGFEVFVHYDYPCRHFKEVDLLDVYLYSEARDLTQLVEKKENINTPEYWDKEWAKREERVYPFYEDLATMCTGKKVLDFGCGRGDLLDILTKTASYAKGYDISSKAVDICQERGLKASIGCVDEIAGHFDIITCTEVLEHLEDDVGTVNKLLFRAPVVIFTVPNDCMPPALEPEHVRVYTAISISQRFDNVKAIYGKGNYLMVVISEQENYPKLEKLYDLKFLD